MPIVAPSGLPAVGVLRGEDVFVIASDRAQQQDIRPIKVVVVNLMPTKVETETQLIRMLSNTPLQVHLTLVHMASHTSAHTSAEHLERFYRTFDDIADQRFDGMIVTGAPVETLDFEAVDYWPELQQILDYAATNVYSSIFLCWAAQAALHHYYRIPKRRLPEKLFGVFEHRLTGDDPLTRGFDTSFWAPQSRHTTVDDDLLAAHPDLRILATSDRTGFHIAATTDRRFVFVSGHGEYDELTLDTEYRRDLARGKPIQVPENYYTDDDPSQPVRFTWRSHGSLMFTNWLNYYVYQETPFDLRSLTNKVVAKFGGSSLADAERMGAARGIIEADPDRGVVVVSAPGKRFPDDVKVTDMLAGIHATSVAKRDLEVEMVRLQQRLAEATTSLVGQAEAVEKRFDEICEALHTSDATRQRVRRMLTEAAHHMEHDFVVSRGEYLSALIMAEHLGYTFVDAAEVIFFDDQGNLDENRTHPAIRRALGEHPAVVIPGFYGRGADGAIRVFERGGSDITGSIVAAATSARLYENWTDVDGVMSDDPATNPEAVPIEVLTYDQLADIANQGARVYHPGAIDPVRRTGVPIAIRSTWQPTGRGTLVSDSADAVEPPVARGSAAAEQRDSDDAPVASAPDKEDPA